MIRQCSIIDLGTEIYSLSFSSLTHPSSFNFLEMWVTQGKMSERVTGYAFLTFSSKCYPLQVTNTVKAPSTSSCQFQLLRSRVQGAVCTDYSPNPSQQYIHTTLILCMFWFSFSYQAESPKEEVKPEPKKPELGPETL